MRRLLRLGSLFNLWDLCDRCAGSPSFKFGDGISFTTFGYTLEPASPPRANVSVPELDAEQIDHNAQVRAVQTGSEPLRTTSRVLNCSNLV